MNEIKRLQQLAGILTEIKINNPNVSEEDIVDLYNKIDEYIQSNWIYDEEPDEENTPEILALDKELDDIMKEYDYRFENGYNDIRHYISKDISKNKSLYQKLQQLDSKINYI